MLTIKFHQQHHLVSIRHAVDEILCILSTVATHSVDTNDERRVGVYVDVGKLGCCCGSGVARISVGGGGQCIDPLLYMI